MKKKESATFFRKSVGDLVSMAQPASPVIIRVRNPGPEVEGVDLRAPVGILHVPHVDLKKAKEK